MAKRKLIMRNILDMTNKAAEARARYERYGFWRFARDAQRQEYFFRGVMRKIMKRKRRKRT